MQVIRVNVRDFNEVSMELSKLATELNAHKKFLKLVEKELGDQAERIKKLEEENKKLRESR